MSKAVPLPIFFLLLSFLVPTELSLNIAGLRLPPNRVALLILVPIASYIVFMSGRARVRSFDIFFLLFNFWQVFAFIQHGSSNGGIVFGGSLALESFGAYIVARAYVRDLPTFYATLKLSFITVVVAGLLAWPETLLGRHFIHDVLKAALGGAPNPIETRLGLTRAYAVFDHPIHLGTYCAGLVALVWYSEPKMDRRIAKTFFMIMATFSALSSAPLLCAFMQIGLIAAEMITRGIKDRPLIMLVLIAGAYLGVSLFATRSPIAILATSMTLDSWTGFYRLMIWEYGMQNVWANPWLGIGLAEWERPWWMVASTVDAFWLVMTMRTGIPTFIFVALGLSLIAFGVGKATYDRHDKRRARIATGWLISLTALVLVGFTVHYWNVLHTYFFFFVGLGGWLADPARKKKRRRRRTSAPRPQPYVLCPPQHYPDLPAPAFR